MHLALLPNGCPCHIFFCSFQDLLEHESLMLPSFRRGSMQNMVTQSYVEQQLLHIWS